MCEIVEMRHNQATFSAVNNLSSCQLCHTCIHVCHMQYIQRNNGKENTHRNFTEYQVNISECMQGTNFNCHWINEVYIVTAVTNL